MSDVKIVILIRPQTLSRAVLKMPKRFHSVFNLDEDCEELMEELNDWIPASEDWIMYEIQSVTVDHYRKNYVL